LSKIFKSVAFDREKKKIISRKIDPVKAAKEQESFQRDDEAQLIEQEQLQVKNKILQDAEETANKMIEAAKEKAAALLEEEQKKVEEWWKKKRDEDAAIVNEVKQIGYQEGYEKGRIQAEQEMKQRYEQIIVQAKQLLEESYQLKEQMIQEAELKIIDLSLAVAEKIMAKEMEINPDAIKGMVREALHHIKEHEKISIHVHPDHFSYLQLAKDDLKMDLNIQTELLIFPDSSIHQGGCMIKTSYGTLDAKIDTQLEELKQTLVEVIGGEKNEQRS